MSFEDDFLNFCLSCDGSLTENNEHGPYCSHACRLADREKGAPTDVWATSPSTPVYEHPSSSMSTASSLSRSFPLPSSGFHLPMAIDFTAYRQHPELSSRSDSAPTRTFSVSSRSSTGSPPAAANTASVHVSEEARRELRRYESFFDQTRRRSNHSSWS